MHGMRKTKLPPPIVGDVDYVSCVYDEMCPNTTSLFVISATWISSTGKAIASADELIAYADGIGNFCATIDGPENCSDKLLILRLQIKTTKEWEITCGTAYT